MSWLVWASRWMPIAGLTVTLLALLDPLEGFPIVLLGGVLILMAALQDRSRHTRMVGAGLGLATLGCATMVVLSVVGGVGGATGRSLWWLATVAPYPIGVLMFVVGGVRGLRERAVRAHVRRP
jgi:hypothetical protein